MIDTRILRMKPEYTAWVKSGRKTATTRMTMRSFGEYELAESMGSFFKVKKTGIVIKINNITSWTPNNITSHPEEQEKIYKAEGFSSWEEFWAVICEINKNKKIDGETLFHTHFFVAVGGI